MNPLPTPENAKKRERINNFLIARGITEVNERTKLIKQYAKTIRSNQRVLAVSKTICTNNRTFNLFKLWIDSKIAYFKPSKR